MKRGCLLMFVLLLAICNSWGAKVDVSFLERCGVEKHRIDIANREEICFVNQAYVVKLKVFQTEPDKVLSSIAIYTHQGVCVERYLIENRLYRDCVALLDNFLIYRTNCSTGQWLHVYDLQLKKDVACHSVARETFILKMIATVEHGVVLQLVNRETLQMPYLMSYDIQTHRYEELPEALFTGSKVEFNLLSESPLVYPTKDQALLVLNKKLQTVLKIKDAFTRQLFESAAKIEKGAWWWQNTLALQFIEEHIIGAFIKEKREWYFWDIRSGECIACGTIEKKEPWYANDTFQFLVGFSERDRALIQSVYLFARKPFYYERKIAGSEKEYGNE